VIFEGDLESLVSISIDKDVEFYDWKLKPSEIASKYQPYDLKITVN
jgi:hypothetical protein